MSVEVEDEIEEVPFAVVVEYLESVASAVPRQTSSRRTSKGHRNGTVPKFEDWISNLMLPIPPRTGAILFRLLFPEKDIRRKYNLQETKLGQHLAHVLKVSNMKQADGLLRWNQAVINEDGVNVGKDGCLGSEVAKILQNTFHYGEETYSLRLNDVDRLLDELASKSVWSNLKDRETRERPRHARQILEDLFDTLSPRQAAYMTQIILKDLRPLLYPVPASSTNQSLNDFNSRAYDELNQWSLMKAWHWAMPRIYRAKADFDRAADLVEQIPRDLDKVHDKDAVYSMVEQLTELEVGVPVDIPKAVKASGTCLASTISKLKGDVWAEVKLDGERMQIHIDMSKPEKDQIQIFSKSHRDSTGERAHTLIPIRAALGLSLIGSCKLIDKNPRPGDKPKIVSGIFEAEMVAWNLTKQRVDEFWRISELKRKPWKTKGQKATQDVIDFSSEEESGNESEELNTQQLSDSHRRHLAVVFFDVLSMNGQSVINSPYCERRKLLESAVHVIPNYAMLVERKKFTNVNDPVSQSALREYYAEIIAERHEGLMLKADQSRYNDYRPGLLWYKVKKDYIKGYGDTADYAILGAGWDRDRARELRVSTATYTAWYVGLCKNLSEVERRGAIPVFEIVFKVLSYGLTRANLDKVNQYAQEIGGFPYTVTPSTLPFKFELARSLSAPDVIFKKPMVFELMGSGFTKRTRWHAYELRWPRIMKAHDLNERDWKTAIDLSEHNQIARRATDPDNLKTENEGSATGPDTVYQAEIEVWKDRLSRDDDTWIKKQLKKRVLATTSTNAYVPDWPSDTSDEFSDTSECLADVITSDSPISSKPNSLARPPVPLSPDKLLAQPGSVPPTRTTGTYLSRSIASSPEYISPTRMTKQNEVEQDVTRIIPSRKRINNTDRSSVSRAVKFRLDSDSEQVDETLATPIRPKQQLESVSKTRSSHFGSAVSKSLTSGGKQRAQRSVNTPPKQSTSAEQQREIAPEDNLPLARRANSKRSLPDSSPQEHAHRSKRRLTEFPAEQSHSKRSLPDSPLQEYRHKGKRRLTEVCAERSRTAYKPMQNDAQEIVSPELPTSTRSGKSRFLRTLPTKDSISMRRSPTKDSSSTRTSVMEALDATRISPVKDSNPPRSSPRNGSNSTSISPTKALRPRLVKFETAVAKSESKSGNDVNQPSSVTAPSPPKLEHPSKVETPSVSHLSTPISSQEPMRAFIVPPPVNVSKYNRPRPSASPQKPMTNSPLQAAIRQSDRKMTAASCPASLPRVKTALSGPTTSIASRHQRLYPSRPSASPHQAMTTFPKQADIHPLEGPTSTVSCPAPLPQVTTELPAPTAKPKLDQLPSKDQVPLTDIPKEGHNIPEAGSSTSTCVPTGKPPWLQASGVQWCLVEEPEDYGISGTRHKSLPSLLKASEHSCESQPSPPQIVRYIFVQQPNQTTIERVLGQIMLQKASNPNVAFVVYDAKALEHTQDGNQARWTEYKIFDWNVKVE